MSATRSACDDCGGLIFFSTTAGSGFDRKVWHHADNADWHDRPHNAVPTEVQIVDRGVVLRTLTAAEHEAEQGATR